MNVNSSYSVIGNNKFNFQIKTDCFEGPLELLLELVEKRKLLINDISLATVTDEYMRTVATMQERSLPHTAQFVTLAATLLLLKSKSLLPVLELTEEENERIDDLEAMLEQYKIYRDAGVVISNNYGKHILYERGCVTSQPVFVVDKYCSIHTLHKSMCDVIADLPTYNVKPRVCVKPSVTLEEMIKNIENRIRNEFRVRFSDLTFGEVEKKTIVVSFLAILELYKQGLILVKQYEHFSDFEIESDTLDTPYYM